MNPAQKLVESAISNQRKLHQIGEVSGAGIAAMQTAGVKKEKPGGKWGTASGGNATGTDTPEGFTTTDPKDPGLNAEPVPGHTSAYEAYIELSGEDGDGVQIVIGADQDEPEKASVGIVSIDDVSSLNFVSPAMEPDSAIEFAVAAKKRVEELAAEGQDVDWGALETELGDMASPYANSASGFNKSDHDERIRGQKDQDQEDLIAGERAGR